MQQDEELLIKKLMAIMNSKKSLTIRDGTTKRTIKINLDITEQPDTPQQPTNDSLLLPNNDSLLFMSDPNHSPESPIASKHQFLPQPQTLQVQDIEENDFMILTQKKDNSNQDQSFLSKNATQKPQDSISPKDQESLLSKSIEKELSRVQSVKSLERNASFNIQNFQTAVKPKKIQLGMKHKTQNKPANEAVLNFIESHTIQQNIQINIKTQHLISSSRENTTNESTNHFSFQKVKSEETPSKKYLATAKQVSESIEMLKLKHPESSEHYEFINQHVLQLQTKVQKVFELENKVEREISQILSASMNNSFRLDSFDMSLFSALKLGINNDPLCEMFIQYIKRNQSQKNQSKNVSASFLFLYSQPLLDIHGNEIVEQINYFQEESIIQKLLKDIKCGIDYIREPATMDKFHYWMNQSIQILHFCGHGVQQKQNYLLFENNVGKSVKMDAETIRKILWEIKTKLKLVFVASCHSESTGKIFCQADVGHVICVRDDHVILDDICKEFVKIFYRSSIHDKMSICDSFKFAKKQLELMEKFSKQQIQKFLVLHNHQKKQCNSFLTIPEGGEFKDLTFKPFYNKSLPSRVENFIPRPRDMHQILKLIESKKRYITITGMPGIGKSTLARQLVRCIQFRNIFKDGVVYVDIRGCQNMNKIIETLDIELFENLTLKQRSLQQSIQRMVKELNEKNVLIVLDNCQHIMASDDKQNFKKMVESMMKSCDDTYFLFTHRISIGRQIDYCYEKIYELNKLNEKQSYRLFFQSIPRTVDKNELGEFFKKEKGINDIAKHPIFEFLNGHPEAICMTASLLSDRSLSELYDLLLKPVKDLSNELGIEQTKLNLDLASNKVVQTAMKISLNVLKNKNKNAYEMIKILSMMPKGLDYEMIGKIISKNYQQSLQKLLSYSLVKKYEKGEFKYVCVHPNIITYVQNEIHYEQKLKYHEKICEEYQKRCSMIYKNVGTLSPTSQKHQEMFLNEEDNYRAIMLRELSIYGEGIQLKRLYIELFQGQYFTPTYSSSYEEEENFHSKKPLIDLSDFESYFNQSYKRSKFNEKVKQINKKENVMLLVVYYITNVFVIKKTSFCQKYIEYGVYLGKKKNQYMIVANLIRLKGCIELARHKNTEARQYFQSALEMFALEGCGLGAASCQGALGYIKYLEQEYASAKMNLQNALKYYTEIEHSVGKYYLNQWLGLLKSKMNRAQNQLRTHKNEAQKLLKQAKTSLKSSSFNNSTLYKHNRGLFIFRFLFNNMSLFLEASFDSDVKARLINPVIKKNINEKGDKPILQSVLVLDKKEKPFVYAKKEEEKVKETKEEKEKEEKPLKSTTAFVKKDKEDETKEENDSSPLQGPISHPKTDSHIVISGSISQKRGLSSKMKKIERKQTLNELFKKPKVETLKEKEIQEISES